MASEEKTAVISASEVTSMAEAVLAATAVVPLENLNLFILMLYEQAEQKYPQGVLLDHLLDLLDILEHLAEDLAEG